MEKRPQYGQNALKIYHTLLPNKTHSVLESNVRMVESAELLEALDNVSGVEEVTVNDPYQLILRLKQGIVPEGIRVAVEKVVREYCQE
jgi:hypothetical protein